MKIRFAIALILLAACTRLLMHFLPVPVYNFSPIGAIALFGGAYLGHRRLALVVPFAALFLSDLVINNFIYGQYYEGFAWYTSIWIYVAFALVMVAGRFLLAGKKTPLRIAASSVVASLIFFLVTNLSVWLESGMYTKDAAGLSTCFVAAIPFLQNTLLGDLFFSSILFGVYAWAAQQKFLAERA
jgi:hypothetical protein